MTTIAHQLCLVHDRIHAACLRAKRSQTSVQLLAVSKTFDASAIIEAIGAGQRAFGENYISEGVEKIEALRRWQALEAARTSMVAPKTLEWHCIGPIQSNKTRLVAENFDWVQSLDRLKIAQRLSEQRPPHLSPLQVCLQVNIDGGANKSGLKPEDTLALAQQVVRLPRLVLRGLMAIPEPAADFAAACTVHARTKNLFDQLNASGLPVSLDTLSMGMTGDLEAAVQAGSTMVRVGTAIFGGRA